MEKQLKALTVYLNGDASRGPHPCLTTNGLLLAEEATKIAWETGALLAGEGAGSVNTPIFL